MLGDINKGYDKVSRFFAIFFYVKKQMRANYRKIFTSKCGEISRFAWLV